MLIAPGHSEAASFNDVGSPHTQHTSGLKVHINAQVLKVEDLNWYYRVLSFWPDIPGELKSATVAEKLDSLPAMTRDQIWSTLSRVRIHVVDPRPYKASQDRMLRSVFERGDAPEFVRNSASEGFVWARNINEMTQQFTAESILRDSFASRTHRMAHAFREDTLFMMSFENYTPPDVVSVSDFNCDPKGIVRKATEWSAKAAAAFHGSMDALETLGAGGTQYSYSPSFAVRRRMLSPLEESHAFDKGDAQQIRVLEEVRGKLVDSIADHHDILYLLNGNRAPMYTELESKESFLVQAADIAAGIAARLFQREGVASLIARFEHVTYNGQRIYQGNIADIEHKLRVT